MDWKDQLKEVIIQHRGQFELGQITPLFRNLSQEHQVPLGTVRSAFYRMKKEVIEVSVTLPMVGSRIDVRVKTITPYGVICETLDASTHGLIHISSVKDEFIEDLNRYFRAGDIIEAEVIHIDGERLGLSTINCVLMDYWNPNTNRLTAGIRIKEEDKPNSEVISYLENSFGKLNHLTTMKLNSLIKDFGLFRFSMVLGKIEPKDYASYILELVESELRGSL